MLLIFAEAPSEPADASQYSFGLFQAFSQRFGEWIDVPDTASEETVVGIDTST